MRGSRRRHSLGPPPLTSPNSIIPSPVRATAVNQVNFVSSSCPLRSLNIFPEWGTFFLLIAKVKFSLILKLKVTGAGDFWAAANLSRRTGPSGLRAFPRLQGAEPQHLPSAPSAFPSLPGGQLPSMAEGKNMRTPSWSWPCPRGLWLQSPLLVGLEKPEVDGFLPTCHWEWEETD